MHILLIDDHALFRSGLKFLLSDLEQGLVFDEAGNFREIESKIGQNFDLILLDWNLPGSVGDQALVKVKEIFSEATIVILSGEEDPNLVRLAIDRGASGFIPKSSLPAVMVNALRLVLAGGIYLPAELLLSPQASMLYSSSGVFEKKSDLTDTVLRPVELLSDRQKDALMLAVKGKSNKEIARELDVSEGTVKQHLSTAFRVLGVANRTEAVYAVAQLNAHSEKIQTPQLVP